MFPQTELDNYKLQVELLQEKLKRSEDNRKQLEEKFETIMKKRNEQEKTMKVKNRIKYKQFLEEQRERNERNKALVKLLERVDQQAAALAARSERLKMMKLQYELYFARLLQMQSLRSVQSSPGQISGVLPLNNIITNANLPVGIQDICQSSSNLSKVSPTISENWGMMANNFSPASSNLPYRFPANVDYFNGQILLSQEPLQRQVNLKSTFGDSMGPSIGYPAQIGTFADTRRNPIEFEHYKPLELNMAQGHQEILPPAAGPIRAARSDNHNRNLNEMQSLGQMSNENDFHGRPTFGGYDEQNGYPPSTMAQQSSETHRPPYQMLTSDKLHSIKQDSSRERMPAEVNEDDKKTDAVEEDDEKLQPMSTARRDITPMEEPKQKTDGPKESMPPPMESSMKKVQDLFATDKLLNNTGRLNAERPRAPPIMWNFGGRIDPQDSNYPIQLGKKEKLSIENIENAIYGERISPVSKKTEIVLEKPERQRIMEKRTFREISLPKEIESFRDTESHEEKSDSSEKEIKVAPKEESPIMNQIGSKSPTPVGSKHSTPVSSKPPTPVGSKTSTPVGSKPSTPIKEDFPYIPPEEPRSEKEATVPAPHQPSIQQYPEGYSKNYEEPIQKEDQLADERKPAEQLPAETPSPSYSNYEYDEKKAPEQVIPPQYETNNETMQQGAVLQQEPYPAEQYQQQDYNQYPGQDYNQQQGYDYQADQYQGEYMQQGYDPNAYYGYDQQGDGQVYQQDGVNYQGEGANYQQGDASYQQNDGTYQQGEAYPQADDGYQQVDSTYQGSESYQQGGETYQSDPAYQSQNQQIYSQGDYNQQQYATNAYPTEYTGTEYANYDDQSTAQLNQQQAQEYAPPQPAVSSEEQQNLNPQPSSNASNSPAPSEVPEGSPKKQDEKLSEEPKDTKSPVPSTPAVMPPSILSTEKPAEPKPNKKKKKVNFVDSETDESSSAPKPQAAVPNNDESDFEFSSN